MQFAVTEKSNQKKGLKYIDDVAGMVEMLEEGCMGYPWTAKIPFWTQSRSSRNVGGFLRIVPSLEKLSVHLYVA